MKVQSILDRIENYKRIVRGENDLVVGSGPTWNRISFQTPVIPQKRESSALAAYVLWLAKLIPAFAAMTVPRSACVSQMTQLPGCPKSRLRGVVC